MTEPRARDHSTPVAVGARDLVLRERGHEFEIISDGVFLMDTRDGRSERLLVSATLGTPTEPVAKCVLIAGLGVGFSLAEALTSPAVTDIMVVEREPAVVAWNRSTTGARTGGCVDDPRVRLEIADLVKWLRNPATERFDRICLDVDNGPHWTVSPGNGWLYEVAGLRALRDRLTEGGVLAVWSSEPVPGFERRLRALFRIVRRREVPVDRGPPDVVYLASESTAVSTKSTRHRCAGKVRP